MTRPFRFGIAAIHDGNAAAFTEHARRAEGLGYSTLQVFDELRGVPFTPVPALAYAAAVTDTIGLAAYVFDNGYRHPFLLAKEAATIDVLSGGRLELGLGAGYSAEEYRGSGIPFGPRSERVERLAETVDILTQLFLGEPVTHAGRFYQLADAICRPIPLQRPRPRLVIGGARQRLLSLAARRADTVSFAFSGPGGFKVDASEESVLRKVEWVREAAGDRFGQLEFEALVNVRFGTSRSAAAADATARTGMPSEWLLASPHLLLGTPAEMAETLQERRSRYGFSYFSVRPHGEMDRFADVIRLLGATERPPD